MAKHDDDNRSNQMNSNNDAYYSSRYGNDDDYGENCIVTADCMFGFSYMNIDEEEKIERDDDGLIGDWYLLNIVDINIKDNLITDLKKVFTSIFKSHEDDIRMALFVDYNSKINTETVYFTPATHSIVKNFNAVPCEKPPCEKLKLLVGHPWSMGFYYPSTQSF